MAVIARSPAKVFGASLLLFFVSLFLTAFSARNPSVARAGFVVVGEVQRPLQLLSSSIQNFFSRSWNSYVNVINVGDENARLRTRVAMLEAHNSRLLEFEGENERLRRLIGLLDDNRLTGVPARVIGYDPSNWLHAVTIDKGERHGIEVGMPVAEGNGVVGQITAVSANTARVLLITDPLSGIDAVVQGSRARGVIEGDGNSVCRWRFVMRDEQVNIGDRVITSGADGIYPKGLLIGVIVDLDSNEDRMFRSIRVKPAVDFTKLEELTVVRGPKRE